MLQCIDQGNGYTDRALMEPLYQSYDQYIQTRQERAGSCWGTAEIVDKRQVGNNVITKQMMRWLDGDSRLFWVAPLYNLWSPMNKIGARRKEHNQQDVTDRV